MSKIPSWSEFVKNRNSLNESFANVKKDATLQTDEFLTKNSVGRRLDADYENDSKEYDKLKKFISGTNQPDPIPSKDGWFVVDEATGQIWHENRWVNPEYVDDIDSAMLSNEKAAQTLANVVSGLPVQAETISKALGKVWQGAKKKAGEMIGHVTGKSVSPERMQQIKYPSAEALQKAAQAGDKEAIAILRQQASKNIDAGTPGSFNQKKQNKK